MNEKSKFEVVPPLVKETPKVYMTAEEIAEEVRNERKKTGRNPYAILAVILIKVKTDGETIKEKNERKEVLRKRALELLELKTPDESAENSRPAQEKKPAATLAIEKKNTKFKKVSGRDAYDSLGSVGFSAGLSNRDSKD